MAWEGPGTSSTHPRDLTGPESGRQSWCVRRFATTLSMSSDKPHLASEDVLNKKMDLCLSNTIVKTGIGFSAGVVLSVLFLRRRAWPVWLGTGFGLGAGYTDCERSFNPVAVPGVRILPASSNVVVPPSRFSQLQNRVGELLGQAREQATEAVDGTSDIRTAAHERFTDLTQSGKEQLEKQLSNLQDSTHSIRDKIAEAVSKEDDSKNSDSDKKVRVV